MFVSFPRKEYERWLIAKFLEDYMASKYLIYPSDIKSMATEPGEDIWSIDYDEVPR